MQEVKIISSAEVRGKRVLLRTSLNVPLLNGAPGDLFRLKAALPTILWLHEHGARIVILAHLGSEGATLEPIVTALSSLISGVPVKFFPGALSAAKAEIKKLLDGECLVLENVRRNAGEESNDSKLAEAFASLGDIYVNDAFADSHRGHASIIGIPPLLPSYCGFLMAEEIARLSPALTPPPHALAIIGGAKFQTKEPLISKLLSSYEKIFLGGALANDVLKVRGAPIGSSVISSTPIPVELAQNERLVVPVDAVFKDEGANAEREAYINNVHKAEQIDDIGPITAQEWGKEISTAPFILWNGPVGVYELGFVSGTDALAEALTRATGVGVVGGGDTLAALQKFSFDPKRVFLSTGGGAMLAFLTAGTLVGIEALRQN